VAERDALRNDLMSLKQELQSQTSLMNENEAQWKKEKDSLQEQMQTMEAELKQAKDNVLELTNKLAQGSQSAQESEKRWTDQITHLTTQLTEVEDEKAKLLSIQQELKDQLEKMTNELQKAEKEKSELEARVEKGNLVSWTYLSAISISNNINRNLLKDSMSLHNSAHNCLRTWSH